MLKVENLTIRFEDREAGQEVVKGISFSVKEGEILGIVGESGSGKTMTALTVMGLLKKHAFLDSGNIYLENLDLLQLNVGHKGKGYCDDISGANDLFKSNDENRATGGRGIEAAHQYAQKRKTGKSIKSIGRCGTGKS